MSLRAQLLPPLLALLLLFAVALVALLSVDLGILKPQLERLASDAAGRDLRIDGPLSIDIGGESVLTVNNLHFANADWADAEDMLSIGRAELRLDTWSLLRGPLTINYLQVEGAELSLQVDSAGRRNWTLVTEATDESDSEDEDGPLDILLAHVLIEDSNVTYLSPEREGPLDLQLDQLAQTHGADDFLTLELRGSLGDRMVNATGRVGSWAALLAQKNVDLELDAQVDTLALSARGRIDDLAVPRRPVLEFSAQAPELNDLMRLLQLPADAEGDLKLHGSLASEGTGPLTLAVSGNIGLMTLQADGSFSALQDPESVDLKLAATGPDLSHILRLAGVHDIGSAPFTLELDLARSGSLLTLEDGRILFAGAQLDVSALLPKFPSPNDGTVNLRLAGPDLARLRDALGLPGRSGGAYSADFDLEVTDEGVEIARLDVDSQLLRATGRATLGPAPDLFGTELALKLELPSLAEAGAVYGLEGLPARGVLVEGAATLLAEGLRTRQPLQLRSGSVRASAEGLVTLRPDLVGSDLVLGLQGPDLAALLGEFVASDALPVQPYDLSGRIRAEESTLEIEELTGGLGSADFEGRGRISRRADFVGTSLEFDISGPALEELTAGIPELRMEPGSFRLSGRLARSDDSLRFAPVNFLRDRAEADLKLDLALPLSQRVVDFDVRADGADLREIIGEPGGFAAAVAPFSVDARGELRGSLISLRSLQASLGEAEFSAAGELDLTPAQRTTAFRARLAIPSLAGLGELNGRAFNDQALALELAARSDSNSLDFDAFRLRIGESDLNVDMRLEKGDVPRLRLDLESDSLVIAPLLEPEPFSYDAEPEFNDGRLIPDIALPLGALDRLDLDLTLSIGELQRGLLRASDVELASSLEDGALTVANLSLKGASGALRSRASLQPRDGTAELTLDVVARDFALYLEEFNGRQFSRLNFDASLSASGDDLREIAASADGVIYADARGGHMRENRFIRKLYGDMLNEILATINPFSKSDGALTFACVIAPLDLKNGFVKTRPEVFVRTDKVRIRSAATVNLESEKLTLQVRTTPEKGLTLSASEILNPYVQIIGTLAAPRLAVDQKGVLIAGGAAAATGGLSVLAKAAIDRLGRFGEPCKAAAKAGISELGSRFPDLELESGQ